MGQLLRKVSEEKCIQLACGGPEVSQMGMNLQVLLPSEDFLAQKHHASSVSEWMDCVSRLKELSDEYMELNPDGFVYPGVYNYLGNSRQLPTCKLF